MHAEGNKKLPIKRKAQPIQLMQNEIKSNNDYVLSEGKYESETLESYDELSDNKNGNGGKVEHKKRYPLYAPLKDMSKFSQELRTLFKMSDDSKKVIATYAMYASKGVWTKK